MSEFMEHRRRVVPRDQDRLSGLALNKVRVVRNDGRYIAVHSFLVAIRVHPGTRTLAFACVWIEVPKPDMLSGGLVLHFPDSHIRMENRYIVNGREREVEKLA